MLKALIDFALKYRFLVFVLILLLIVAGSVSIQRLPIDAVPDVTNVQVQVLTSAPALGPLEVEQYITAPVERAMSGLPQMTEIRSVSRPGLSAVTIVFTDDTDIHRARQLVSQRLEEARKEIPEGFGDPEMGPVTSGLGEVYQFEVRGEGRSAMELRTILEWQIAPQLRTVPGVIEVNSFGGELKTYEVQVEPDLLRKYDIGLKHLYQAIEENNANAGGAYIAHAGEAHYIRGEGLVQSLEDVETIVVATRKDGTPIYVRNVGKVRHAPMVRQGAVTRDGRGEAVTGIVMMLLGANSREVVDRVKAKMKEIEGTLPPGVTVEAFYDRTDLVRKTVRTASINLTEGCALVILVLVLLLANVRASLIVAAAIPLSMLFAFAGMVQLRISGNLMSLGAIDFGLIVDGAVVMIENILRHLSKPENALRDRREVVREAAVEVAKPVLFGVGIIIVVYLPILTLEGVEGKMFRPMALTVIFALLGSLVLSLTLMPVLAFTFLRAGRSHEDAFPVRAIKKAYSPVLGWCMGNPALVVAVSLVLLLGATTLALDMGTEFVPELDEGAVAMQAWRLPSVSLEQSNANTTQIETVLKRFPEVDTVVSKTGRAEIATDPMGVEISDIFIMLKPREQWTVESKEALIEKMDRELKKEVPGTMFSYSQPIELRVSELIAGVRSDVALKIYGDDLEVLKAKADKAAAVLRGIPGASDVKVEQVAGLPSLRVAIRREALARYGINASEVLDTIRAFGGRPVGVVFEGQKRFVLQVRFAESARDNLEKIRTVRIRDAQGRLVPLSELAEIWTDEGPAQVSREKIRRRITIEANVRGRDLGSFVAEARREVGRDVPLPSGYEYEWGGQFENLERASQRLAIVVPLTLLLIFVLLYATFHAVKPAILIYLNVPFAAVGGVLALALRGMHFSISAAVGFIALFGVAVLNGVVLVTYLEKLRQEGRPAGEAVREGALVRLRPVLMTALVASLGFIPMALSTGAGAEVQRPLATVVIGGLVTSTLLTLLVLPTIYAWVAARSDVRESRR